MLIKCPMLINCGMRMLIMRFTLIMMFLLIVRFSLIMIFMLFMILIKIDNAIICLLLVYKAIISLIIANNMNINPTKNHSNNIINNISKYILTSFIFIL